MKSARSMNNNYNEYKNPQLNAIHKQNPVVNHITFDNPIKRYLVSAKHPVVQDRGQTDDIFL